MPVSDIILDHAKKHVEEDMLEMGYGYGMIWGTIEGKDGQIHTPDIHVQSGEWYCGCKGSWYSEDWICSHIVALALSVRPKSTQKKLLTMLRTGNTPDTQMINKNFVHTRLDNFNELMSYTNNADQGGMYKKSGIGLTGKPEAGKTIFTSGLAFDMIRELSSQDPDGDHNALFVDTEGSLPIYEAWAPIYRDRFGIDAQLAEVHPIINGNEVTFDTDRPPEADHYVFVMDCRDLQDILKLHGRPASIETGNTSDSNNKKPQMNLRPAGDFVSIEKSPIGQFVKKNDVEFMVYDSISNPLEIFTNNRQDRPVRAKATQWWLLQSQKLAQDNDLMQMYVAHASKDPANRYERPQPVGGKAFLHQLTFSLYLAKRKEGKRAIKLFRHPSKPEWEQEWLFDMKTGVGYLDLNTDD